MNRLAFDDRAGEGSEVALHLAGTAVDVVVGSTAHGRYSNINQCATFHPPMKPAIHISMKRTMRTIFNSRSAFIDFLPESISRDHRLRLHHGGGSIHHDINRVRSAAMVPHTTHAIR